MTTIQTPYTPGPWEQLDTLPGITHRGEIIEIGPRPYVAMRGKTVVAYVVSAPDARLIAAAPGLLDALTELVAVPNKHRPDRVWEQARAAIRRATEGGK